MSSQINTTVVSPNRAINTPDESYADESNQRSVTPMPLITTAIPKNPGSNNQSNYSASSTSTTSNRSNQTSTAVNSSIIPRSIPSNRVTPAPIITSTINSSVIPQSSSPSPKSSKSQSNTPTAATSTHHKHTIDETGGGIIASMPPPQTATITRRPAAPKKSTVTRPTKTAMLPPPNSPASRAQTAQSRLTYRKFISWLWNPCGFLHRSKISGAGSHFTTRKGLTNNGTGGTNRMSGKPPSNYQGPQPPLLKPSTEPHKKCLVLDLDETLVHSAFRPLDNADFVIPVNIDEESFNVYVLKRPWVDAFLKKAAELYEIVVFTASLSKYADPVIDKLDRHKVVKHRLFRESCVNIKGNFVKDLSMLGRDLKKVVILDNSAASYLLHPKNAIPITTWYSDPQDRELADVMQLLVGLSKVDDVTLILNGNVKK